MEEERRPSPGRPCLTPFSSRITERTGPRVPVVTGLVLMAAGAVALALVPATFPVWASALLLIPVGLAGPRPVLRGDTHQIDTHDRNVPAATDNIPAPS